MSTVQDDRPRRGCRSAATPGERVKARGYWERVWLRLKRDRLAIAGGIFVIFLFLVSFAGAPIAAHVPRPRPERPVLRRRSTPDTSPRRPDDARARRRGRGQRQLFILGADSTLGRDLLPAPALRRAHVSLEVAVFATRSPSVSSACCSGRWPGTSVARRHGRLAAHRARDGVPGAPLHRRDRGDGRRARLNKRHVRVPRPRGLHARLVFSLFGWFYPARIVRGQVLSLREKEFVEAARMTGASDWRIVRSHLLPHLVGPVIVYATLIVASLHRRGRPVVPRARHPGCRPSSWGNILAQAPQYYLTVRSLMIWPGLAILLTTLAFNLLGDGLRDAFDPRKLRANTNFFHHSAVYGGGGLSGIRPARPDVTEGKGVLCPGSSCWQP